ncbi:hypothetical protein CBI38_15465 [Rhodococcus oxybenzonivorans]|uniref:Uncharacterized protein n=1 Tax=Rhodococcus oxybenzonivorans TaxID=1990687 RepID=A0A2S2BVV3_9NOCA|nr:hypothetical protein CBI38_15465 [Rhodococcus oxybenzonivorans]
MFTESRSLRLGIGNESVSGASLRRWTHDPISGVAWVHTPAMTVDSSWSQFLWVAVIFVGVPSMIGAGIIRLSCGSGHSRANLLWFREGP